MRAVKGELASMRSQLILDQQENDKLREKLDKLEQEQIQEIQRLKQITVRKPSLACKYIYGEF